MQNLFTCKSMQFSFHHLFIARRKKGTNGPLLIQSVTLFEPASCFNFYWNPWVHNNPGYYFFIACFSAVVFSSPLPLFHTAKVVWLVSGCPVQGHIVWVTGMPSIVCEQCIVNVYIFSVLYCSWRFIFYLATSIYGLVILFKVAHCSVMGYIWEVVRTAFLRRPNTGLFVGFNR